MVVTTCLRAAAIGTTLTSTTGAPHRARGATTESADAELSVVLLSADNAQIQLAKANGLAACKIHAPELAQLARSMTSPANGGTPLTASLVEGMLAAAGARVGVHEVRVGPSLQDRYDAGEWRGRGGGEVRG